MIGDDGDASDGNIHMSQADSLSNIIANNYNEINISKIYLDSYLQESTPGGPRSSATQSAINNKINNAYNQILEEIKENSNIQMITKNKNERLSIALRKNLKKRKIFQKKNKKKTK